MSPPSLTFVILHLQLVARALSAGEGAGAGGVCAGSGALRCSECILLHPSCAWCSQKDFPGGRSRCDLQERLLRSGCPADMVEAPRSQVQLVQALPLSDKPGTGETGETGKTRETRETPSGVVQISPQEVSLSLRPGDPATVRVQVRQVEDYPLDLYYLMDLSLSMKDDLDNIRVLGAQLEAAMARLTSKLRLGFGSFVDKPVSPFTNTAPAYLRNPCLRFKRFPVCGTPFGFRHVLALTERAASFIAEVQRQNVSRNNDAPEGGFDAILQASVCGEQIGWRGGATHLVVFATDAGSHLALDGRLAGLATPHDGRCHLDPNNSYARSSVMDYPSLALLGEKLSENNVNLIFAVTRQHYALYRSYAHLLPGTTAGILANDSSNIIQLIVSAYNSIRSVVELEVWDQPEDVSVSFTATCQNGTALPGQRRCADLRVGDTVSFEVRVEARGCVRGHRTFTVKPVGFEGALRVHVRGAGELCACACARHAEPRSSACSGNGSLECGVCSCAPGRLGPRCECSDADEEEDDATDPEGRGDTFVSPPEQPESAGRAGRAAGCRREPGATPCSGRGDCVCGQCVCRPSELGKVHGSWCECDDFSCIRHKGLLCSGHGPCVCGECACDADWAGESCNCSLVTDACVSAEGLECSGRGRCECGRCVCTEPGASGSACQRCPTCPDACARKKECVECFLASAGVAGWEGNCSRRCADEVVTVQALDPTERALLLCSFKLENECTVRFSHSEDLASGRAVLRVLARPECAEGPAVLSVLLAVAGGVLLLGVVALLSWKLLVTLHDRHEFARFQEERARAKWGAEHNPLFKRAVTTFPNVSYRGSQ
ncbi:integrin beta-3-like [Lampetra fluviatilis]